MTLQPAGFTDAPYIPDHPLPEHCPECGERFINGWEFYSSGRGRNAFASFSNRCQECLEFVEVEL